MTADAKVKAKFAGIARGLAAERTRRALSYRSRSITFADVSPALAFLFAALALFVFSAFGYDTVPAIALPETEDIASVTVTLPDGETVTHDGDEFLSDALALLGKARATSIPSVTYEPTEDNAVKAELVTKDGGTVSLFLYRKNGKFYIEQPCHGVYETTGEFFDLMLGEK